MRKTAFLNSPSKVDKLDYKTSTSIGEKVKRNSSSLRNASREHLSFFDEILAFIIAKTIYKFSWMRTRVMVAGSVAEYLANLSEFGKLRIFSNRENLWEAILRDYELEKEQNVYFEFGVAWGYLTSWWTQKIKNDNVKWHGFDRFIGLPRKWETLPEGAFSANGATPQILDERISWHIGDVEATIQAVAEAAPADFHRRVIFFDLDIYEPTKIAYENLRPYLRKGDILYFDEARMADEWKLISEQVIKDFNFKVIGVTFNCLAVEIIDI